MIIDPSIYSQFVVDFTDAIDDGTDMLAELTSMGIDLSEVTNSDFVVVAVARTRNALISRNGAASPLMIRALASLQAHVTRYAGSVNAYLAANFLTVPQSFADASSTAGYPIDELYIAD